MTLNAVERRLMDIRVAWERFTADAARRALVWSLPASSGRLAECFFEAQKLEVPYSTRDLCIVFKEPFEHSIQYSRALQAALAGMYEASREDIAAEGIPADWRPPAGPLPASAYGVVQALRSFGASHHQHFGHLAAVLMPTEVSSDAAFAGWLRRALDAAPPERLRIAALDPAEAPRLAPLAADPRVLHETLALDIMAVAQETFAQERPPGPAGTFRDLMTALVVLSERGSPAEVRAKAAQAYAFAGAQGWSDQQSAVAAVVGGAQMRHGQHDTAVESYRFADAAAVRATEAGNPAGPRLRIQSRFGEAGAHFAAARPAEAAACYDEAAAMALALAPPDLVLAIEAVRMAAFCHARMEDRAGAIARGRRALDLGARLRADARNLTSLPIAASDLLRVIDPQRSARIEALRASGEAGSEAALAQAEAQAAALERVAQPDPFEAVECGLAAADAAAWQQ
ncbi:hypothetical protein, partial [Roseomonas rosulenta]|uniref:hypothetical protein n=1 Tax=Roseomonas rosulenta TaxID=2748667 RepID=UPI0018DFC626